MKKGILFLVLALATILLQSTFFASANELTDDYLDIATNYFKLKDYTKAKEYTDLIINLEPDNVAAKELIDKMNQQESGSINVKQPEIVQESLEQPKPVQESLEQTKSTQEVKPIEPPKVVEEKLSYDSDYYNKKGKEFYNKNDFENAIKFFYKAILLDKKNPQAFNNLAMAYLAKDNQTAAIKYFKMANSLNKSYTQPLVNLAAIYGKSGDKKNQLYYLQQAIKYNSNDYLAYYYLGDYYRCDEKYLQAIKSYKEAVKINPQFANGYLNLAMCFFETEEFNYSMVALKQYMAFYPNSDFALSLMARINLVLYNYDNAKIYIQKAIEVNNCSDYQLELAKINYYLEDYQGALSILQNLLMKSETAEVYNYIGLCNYKLKNIEAAITNFNNAINLNGLRPIYYYNLAQCYKSIGDRKNYSKYVNMATCVTPVNYQDFIDLSYIYFDNGSPNYAINTLNNAISKYPEIKSLYLAKLKIYDAINDNLHYNETKDLIETRFNQK